MLRIMAHIPPKVKTLNGYRFPVQAGFERVPLPRSNPGDLQRLKIIKILIKIVH
jgi:hypothetical protein